MRLALDLALEPLPAMPARPTREQLRAILNGNVNTSWYDLSDLANNKANSDGTGALALGGRIGFVYDQSGNGRHLMQSNDTARPVLVFEDGVYSASCDGVDDFLVSAAADLAQGTTAYLMWAGTYFSASGASFAGVWQSSTRYFRAQGNTGGPRINLGIRGASGTIHISAFSNGAFPFGVNGVLDGQATPSQLDAKAPSGATSQVAVSTDTSNPTSRIQLGGSANQAAALPSRSAGLVIYAGTLAAEHRDTLRSYFS